MVGIKGAIKQIPQEVSESMVKPVVDEIEEMAKTAGQTVLYGNTQSNTNPQSQAQLQQEKQAQKFKDERNASYWRSWLNQLQSEERRVKLQKQEEKMQKQQEEKAQEQEKKQKKAMQEQRRQQTMGGVGDKQRKTERKKGSV